METVGERLKKVRKHFDYKQPEFSKLLGYEKFQALSNIEQGNRNLPVDKAEILQNELGVNMNWLLLGKGVMFFDEEKADAVLAKRGMSKKHDLQDDEAALKLLDEPDVDTRRPWELTPSVSPDKSSIIAALQSIQAQLAEVEAQLKNMKL